MHQIILASSSQYRKKLLDKLGINAIAIAPNIDETPQDSETPKALVERLAIEKATIIGKNNKGLIIGSDQVASIEGDILGKPGSINKAIEQLGRCSGKCVTFFTGLCLFNSNSQKIQSSVETFTVFFRELSTEEIRRYIDIDQPLDCAGSFKSEGLGISLFEKMHGDDPNTLVGLPLIRLCQFLRNEGCNPLL